MFSVLFEVHPKSEKSDAYLGYAKMLKPELEKIDGFVDNVRYRSLTREGWILSLSNWRDEKALVRWRTLGVHHGIQEQGRNEVFLDYHLRVGQLTRDTQLPSGQSLPEQRLDETEIGQGTTVTLIDARQSTEWVKHAISGRHRALAGLELQGDGHHCMGCFRCGAHAGRYHFAHHLARQGIRGSV